jgi:serine/threonine protein kinase
VNAPSNPGGESPPIEDDDTPTAPLSPGRQRPLPRRIEPQVTAVTALTSGPILAGRYVLEDIIGRGGTSVVFRARDLRHSSTEDSVPRLVALKLLRAEQRGDPSAVARLKHEFRSMQRLSHPGIVQVFDLDCDGEVWFMSMELVTGRTASHWMQTPGSRADALRIIAACCEALDHAHLQGVLHGDLKPTNVMVADDGTVKLIDFGSAPLPRNHTAGDLDSIPSVTALYASPQVLAGKSAEPRDDVFSLACLSYGILSGGRHPFGRRPSLEDGRSKSAPTYVSSIPATLFEAVERGLSAERERRPASAGEFLRALTAPAVSSLMRAPWASANAIYIAEAAAVREDPFESARLSLGNGQPPMRLIALAVLIFSATVFFRHGTLNSTVSASDSNSGAGMLASAPGPSPASPSLTATDQAAKPAARDTGVISFVTPTVHASASQPIVAISVRRLTGTQSRAAFTWRVEHGTAHPGVDYQPIEPHVVRFLEGQAVRTLFIPLLATPAALKGPVPRTFTVALEQVAGGPALGRISRVTVALDPSPSVASTYLASYQSAGIDQ